MALARRNRPSGKTLFADTGFWVALLRERDQYGDIALRWNNWLSGQTVRIVTTEAVLWELLNSLAHPQTRAKVAKVYHGCHEGTDIEVVPFQPLWVRLAFNLYETRNDKEWSLTDCLSFIVMKERGLTDALTADHHFVQADFRASLLEEPPS